MFGEHKEQYDAVYGQEEHEGKLSHELLAGGASFFAMKKWEDEQRQNGQEVSHSFAKEAIAGIAGAEIDKLVETKGLDYIDSERAKREASEQIDRHYDNNYNNGGDNWTPDNNSPYGNNNY